MGSQEVAGTRTSKKPGCRQGSSTKKRGKSKQRGRQAEGAEDSTRTSSRCARCSPARRRIVVKVDRASAIRDVVTSCSTRRSSRYVLTGADDLLDDGVAGRRQPTRRRRRPGSRGRRRRRAGQRRRALRRPRPAGAVRHRQLRRHALPAAARRLRGALRAQPAGCAEGADDRGRRRPSTSTTASARCRRAATPTSWCSRATRSRRTSNVLLVVCNGRVVVDNREQAQ